MRIVRIFDECSPGAKFDRKYSMNIPRGILIFSEYSTNI